MPDRPRKLSFIFLLPLCCPAAAQDVSQAELVACAAKASTAEKLACYESLTVMPEAATSDAEARAPAAETNADIAEPAVTEAVQDPSPAVTATAPAGSAVDARPAMPVAAAPAAKSVAPPAPAGTASPTVDDSHSRAPDHLGQEQLDTREEDAEPFPVTAMVSEVTQSSSGRLYFHFANGQVWRQIEPRRFRYPQGESFEVTVSQGMMKEYRLRVGGEGPMTRIRRVK